MNYETILYERSESHPSVALVTLDRPERLNAINRTMLRELEAACDEAERDDGVRALVLTGAGNTFSSGFDLKEQAANPPRGVREWRPVLADDFEGIMRFWRLRKPTVAAVRGHVLAGAFEMMLACDVTVAAEGCMFGEPELKFGAGIVAMLLPWYAGPKIAKELILLADDRVDTDRALALGLVNRVVPLGEEVNAALALAGTLARMDPMVVRQTKAAINRTYEIMGLAQALAMALDVDVQIEGEGSDHKREFLRRAREDGLRAAIEWRDSRVRGDGSG